MPGPGRWRELGRSGWLRAAQQVSAPSASGEGAGGRLDLMRDVIGHANLWVWGFLLCYFFLADLAPSPLCIALKRLVTVLGTCAGTT